MTQSWALQGRPDCLGAAALARARLLEGGWRERDAFELTLVVAELASNAVRHAGGGVCTLEVDPDQWVVTVRDRGPGFPAQVLADAGRTDGLEPRVGLGSGLPCARRLSDELVLENLSPSGAQVIARKQRRRGATT